MNVFDILGPVMIGPSSSHTAGAARIGRIARTLLGTEPVKADILLQRTNSFPLLLRTCKKKKFVLFIKYFTLLWIAIREIK